jgi:branched-chain amino acid transport system ATP-binding protein
VEEHLQLAMRKRNNQERKALWQTIGEIFPKLIKLKRQIAGKLSGGERIILSIACIIATDANFLILDEPTAGLSPETCKVVKDFLIHIKTQKDKTILLLEHNYDFAMQITDSVILLKEGVSGDKYPATSFNQPGFIESKLYGIAI